MRITVYLMYLFGILLLLTGCPVDEEDDVIEDLTTQHEPCAVSMAELPTTSPLLVINEFKAHENYKRDWIEIYSFDIGPVSMAGLSLWADDGGVGDDQQPWEFPPEVTIEPNDYLVVFCDQNESTEDELHASFRIERDDGSLRLFFTEHAADWESSIDHVDYGFQDGGESCARQPDAGLTWDEKREHTRGASND